MANTKEKLEEKKIQLTRLTKSFSEKYLNEEYDALIEKLINKMARKREAPFLTGKIEIWAAAIIHALGTINFLFDKNTKPYVSVADICEFFETKQSSTTQKSKKIRDMFKMTYFDSTFSTENVNQHNPFQNLDLINGLLVPQDMLQTEKKTETELDEWELEVAKIIEVTGLVKGKCYSDHERFASLEVTEERLIKFYHSLSQSLQFPFSASYSTEAGALNFVQYDVECIRLEQKMKVDEFYGILVECRRGKEQVILPLAEIEVEENNSAYGLIELYKDWFWNYR